MNEESLLAAVVRSQLEGLEEDRKEREKCLVDLFSVEGWAWKLNLDVNYLIEHMYGKEYLEECKKQYQRILKERKHFDNTVQHLLTQDLTWQDFISAIMKHMPKNMTETERARKRIHFRKIWYQNQMNKSN